MTTSKEDWGDNIDMAAFEQILEMDEPDDNEFSSSIVFGFFEQASQTFDKMDDAVKNKDLKELSSLGHFLKGSSATLGLTKVKDACEKIQHYGNHKDENGNDCDIDDKTALNLIRVNLEDAKDAFHTAERLLRDYYEP